MAPSATVVFQDDFNQAAGSLPSSSKWGAFNATDPNNANGTTVVYQSYTGSMTPAAPPLQVVSDAGALDGKALAITLTKDQNVSGQYDSGEIRSSVDPVGGALQYGHIEARIKLPGGPNGQGDGIWPAFWMINSNYVYNPLLQNLPDEIDIMENAGTRPGINQATIHGPGYLNPGATSQYVLPNNQAFYSSYHVFAMDWSPSSISFSVDGNVYAKLTPASLPAGGTWVFDQPFYIILDVAEGSGPNTFAGSSVNGISTYPQTMLVDYVRAYAEPPIVTGVTPTTPLYTTATSVTIVGSGFTGATAVNFGQVAATNVQVQSDTEITATVAATPSAPVDPNTVTVTTPDGTSDAWSTDGYNLSDVDFFTMPNTFKTNLGTFLVSGTTDPGNTVTVNGTAIPAADIDPEGDFAVPVALAAGSNALTVTIATPGGQQVETGSKAIDYEPAYSTANLQVLYVDSVNSVVPGTIVLDLTDGAILGVLLNEHVRGISPDGTQIYMDDRNIISTATHRVVGTLPFSQPILPNGFLVSPVATPDVILYSGNQKYDVTTGVLATLPIDITTGNSYASAAIPGGPAISSDGKTIYAGQSGGSIVKLDTTSNTYVTLPGIIPRYYLSGLSLSPDGTKLLVASYGGTGYPTFGQTDVYNTATQQLLGTINQGDFTGPADFVNNNIAILGNAGNPGVGGGQLNVINVGSPQVIQTIPGMLADNLVVTATHAYASTGDRAGVDDFSVSANGSIAFSRTFLLGINRYVQGNGAPANEDIRALVYKPSPPVASSWIGSLQFPSGDAKGAIAEGGNLAYAMSFVNPYFANQAVSADLQTGAPHSLAVAENWIEWYLQKINPDGSIDNFTYDSSGAFVSQSMPDSVDAYAGTFLYVLWQYVQAGGDLSIFQAAGAKQQIMSIASAILALQQSDGLTWARADYLVKYLADNSEAYAGLRAAAQVMAVVYGDVSTGALYDQAADRIRLGIQNKLVDPVTGLFGISLDSSGQVAKADFQSGATWASGVYILWPALYGVIDPMSVQAQAQLAALNVYWNGSSASQVDWTSNIVDNVNVTQGATLYPWPVAAYAALLSGDALHGQTHTNWVLAFDFPNGATIPTGYFTVADAGFLALGQAVVNGTDTNVPATATISAVTPNPAAGPVSSLTISFSSPVTGFNLSDLQLVRGVTNIPLTGATLTTGDNQTWTLGNLTGLTGTTGNYVLTLTATGSGIIDANGNALAAGATELWTVGTTLPTVLSINRTTPAGPGTNASSVVYTVTFNEGVSGVDPTDFGLALNGVTTAPQALVVSGSASTYTVTINGIAGSGTLGLNLTDDDSIKDGAGNSLGGTGIGNGSFIGQTYTIGAPTVPMVVSVTPSATTITGAQVGSTAFSVNVAYSEAMNIAVAPAISFTPSVASTLTFVSGNWNAVHTAYTAVYNVANASVNIAGVAVTVSGAQDVAGNTQVVFNQGNVFAINTLNPVIVSATPTVATIADAQAGLAGFKLALQYSVPMKTTISPTITFSPVVSTTLTFASGNWNAAKTIFTAVYNVADAGLSVPSVAITVSGAQSAAGNAQLAFNQGAVFAIDTANPTVTSIVPNVAVITDAQTGTAAFRLTIQYSGAMSTAVSPTISFSPAISSTLVFASGIWDNTSTLYTASYNVADAGVSVAGVTATVSGARNADGNLQVARSQNAVFAIDTVNPTVTSISPSIATITDAQAGTTFKLAVQYNVAMNTAVTPAIIFNPAVASTLTFASGSWNAARTIYTATYNVGDAGVSVSGIAVTVRGALNADGNVQVVKNQLNVFAIDTANPVVTSIATSAAMITDAVATFSTVIQYGTLMNAQVAPVIGFSPGVGSTLTFASGSWNLAHTAYTAVYNVVDASASVAAVAITVSGARSADGNTQVPSTRNAAFAIDTVNSTVTSITPGAAVITDALTGKGTFTLAIQYNMPMKATVAPLISFAPAVNTTLGFTSGTWDNTHTLYTAFYNVADAGVNVPSVTVAVSGARNIDGNVQIARGPAALFAIDMANPIVTSITPSTPTITNALTGGIFTLAIQYGAPMNTTVAPAISFTPAVSSTLSFTSGSWSTAHTVYTAVYNVANASVSVSGISVTVKGALNADGNLQVAKTQNAGFVIDTVTPIVVAVQPSAAIITDAQSTFRLAIQYNTPMNSAISPTIVFGPVVNSTLTFASGSWNALHNLFTAVYNVADAGVSVPAVAVAITGAKNANGNTQAVFTQNGDFAIDTANPTVAAVTPSVAIITDAQVGNATFTLAIQFGTAMNNAVVPVIGLPASASATLIFAFGLWNPANTIYTASYNIANAGVKVPAVMVTVSGGKNTDGNSQVVFGPTTVFSIDTANPTVVSAAPSVAVITNAQTGVNGFNLVVTYSGAMNSAFVPAIDFSPDLSSILAFNSGSWNAANTVYTASYNVAATSVNITGVEVVIGNGQSSVGNPQVAFDQAGVFAIDTVSPTVVSITPNSATITRAQIGTATFKVAVQYSTAMNTVLAPTINFNSTVSSILTFASGSWDATQTLYTATYNVANVGISLSAIAVTVSGARSKTGNTQVSLSQDSVFVIDTATPTVTSITPSAVIVNDLQTGASTFSLSLGYSDFMNAAVVPNITFSPAVGSVLTFASGTWNATNTVYTASYSVANVSANFPGIGVTVSGAINGDGNPQATSSQNSVFAIDTINPNVVSVTPSVPTVTDTQVGSNGLSISVRFNTVMDTTVSPTISFSPDLTSTLTFVSGAWDPTHTTYTAHYNVADAGVTVPSVQVTVSDGQSADGNLQVSFDQFNAFGIATVL